LTPDLFGTVCGRCDQRLSPTAAATANEALRTLLIDPNL
jgi:hypothetical protein